MKMDYSTLNLDEMAKLPAYKLPPSYHLQQSHSNGWGDPPGYPTYFTRCVFTSKGNSPGKGALLVIAAPGVDARVLEHTDDWNNATSHEAVLAILARRLHSLWKPLPIEHPRVQAWIRDTYKQWAHCYQDLERHKGGKPGLLVYPLPGYKLKRFEDDPRWNEAYRTAKKAEVDAFNRQELAHARKIAANPCNHKAVIRIKTYYPEHEPDLALIAEPPKEITGWWETEAEKPAPAACAPPNGKHPLNGAWCQWCGFNSEVSGEVSGEVRDEVSGEVRDEVSDEVSDEVRL